MHTIESTGQIEREMVKNFWKKLLEYNKVSPCRKFSLEKGILCAPFWDPESRTKRPMVGYDREIEFFGNAYSEIAYDEKNNLILAVSDVKVTIRNSNDDFEEVYAFEPSNMSFSIKYNKNKCGLIAHSEDAMYFIDDECLPVLHHNICNSPQYDWKKGLRRAGFLGWILDRFSP